MAVSTQRQTCPSSMARDQSSYTPYLESEILVNSVERGSDKDNLIYGLNTLTDYSIYESRNQNISFPAFKQSSQVHPVRSCKLQPLLNQSARFQSEVRHASLQPRPANALKKEGLDTHSFFKASSRLTKRQKPIDRVNHNKQVHKCLHALYLNLSLLD